MINRYITLCLIATGLAACSGQPVSPVGEAVYFALQTDTSLRTWADACHDVSPASKNQARSARYSWWQRNGSLVEGADFGLAYDMIRVSDTRPETGARMALALTWQVVETADKDVKELMGGTDNKEELCQRILRQYEQGERDLKNDEALYHTLLELQNRKRTESQALELKRASIEKQTRREYGRSFYVVEKIARRNGCQAGSVQLLKSAWPYEVYDVTCSRKQSLLARCEWSNCSLVD